MWIVFNALLLYNIAVASGRFDAFREWVLDHLPNDRRIVLVVIGFCFGCLLEGISGFGTPVAITSALLILVGFPPLEALTFTLIFNTAPVAFGALGVPVTVLGQVTGLPAVTLGAMIGRQLPCFWLRDGGVWGHAFGAGAVAGVAGGRRQVRGRHSLSRPTTCGRRFMSSTWFSYVLLYWPAGTAAFHVNADIALAAARYVHWTGDAEFDRQCALPLLVQTARLWMSLGYFSDDEKFHIDGITGPDEYSALVDDNTYTNLTAARNLPLRGRRRRAHARRGGGARSVPGRGQREWRRADAAMAVPYDQQRQMPEQHRDSTRHERWDFDETAKNDRYPLLLNYPYFEIYRAQVVKQADLVLALHWCGDNFTLEEKARAFAYYEELTVRDSSLSACTQAVVAAEVGQLELAHDYLNEAALMDLHDLEHNTRDGVHVASLAGSWLALVCGFGGMRDYGGRLSFAPRLPTALTRLSFALRWQGATVRVVVTADRLSLDGGSARRAAPDAPRSAIHPHGADWSSWIAPTDPAHRPTPSTGRSDADPSGGEPRARRAGACPRWHATPRATRPARQLGLPGSYQRRDARARADPRQPVQQHGRQPLNPRRLMSRAPISRRRLLLHHSELVEVEAVACLDRRGALRFIALGCPLGQHLAFGVLPALDVRHIAAHHDLLWSRGSTARPPSTRRRRSGGRCGRPRRPRSPR